jgi:heterodisulfide reductase subunit A-like polyferredoxin
MSNNNKVGAALVVGGGVGGMQAALDLAEAGIRTYLLDRKTAIGGVMVQLDKTFPTNDCAMCTIAPRLVNIGRHLNIEVLTNAEIEKVTGSAGNFNVTIKKKGRYIDLDKCTGCAACVEKCPMEIDSEFDQELVKRKAIYRRYPQAIPSAFAIDKEGVSPCRTACPAGVNPHAYIALLKAGRLQEAYELIKKAMPFSGICGRVCHHPCEAECYRGKLLDEPIAICALKRYITDTVYSALILEQIGGEESPPVTRMEKVAVIGAGPAGLTCAHDLASLGYKVTIFDSLPHAGGMMRRAIPRYRLSPELVDREVGDILTHDTELLLNNIELQLNTAVGKDVIFADLRQQFDAIFIAVGAQLSRSLSKLPGIESGGVILALPFLEEVNNGGRPSVGERVVVIGGGNVAFDVARTALRIGAKEVDVVCLESWDEMLCHPWEREEAVEEGIRINNSLGPKRLIGENGKVRQAEFLEVESIFDAEGRFNPTYLPDTEKVFDCDTVIIAIGQGCDLGFLDGALELNPAGTMKVDPITLETSVGGVFAGGDVVKGPASIVEAVGAGHEAAISIDRYLNGQALKEGRKAEVVIAPEPKTDGLPKKRRAATKRLPPGIRKSNFEEVVLPLTAEEATAEVERCLACAKCCECRECEKACEAKAINHEAEREERSQLNVGAIILAPGFELFNPEAKKEFGYGRYPNVITGLEFERILSASGPFGGELLRPSDGTLPQKIAFIQCVGSREIDANYCSAVCCMYATKEAIIVKEHHPETDITIFFTDLRAFGKGFEVYYEQAKKLGIKYIRCQPSSIKEEPRTKDLNIQYQNEDGEIVVENFALTVLSCGLRPPAGARELAEKLGFGLNEFGFYQTGLFSPVETSREGIYACGLSTGPKDIPETVIQGSAAAAKALSLLCNEKGKLLKEKTYPPEKDVKGEEPRIGVFVCHCGKNIGGVVNVPEVVEYAKTLPNVVYAESNLYTCSTDTGERIKQVIDEYNLNRLIVASCTPRTHEPLFQDTLREAGLNPYLFEMANIRDQCSWVHMHEPEEATKKAKDLVRMAVAKSRLLQPLYPKFVDVNHDALVIGGGVAGMTAALELAEQGFETYLLEKDDLLGGNLRRVKFLLNGVSPQAKLESLIEKVQNHPRIHIHTGAEILKFEGSVGNFKTEFSSNGDTHVINHGVVIVATGAQEYKPTEYLYGQDERVITQLELEERLTNGDIGARVVAMVQCTGSREEPRVYCSRICCSQGIKNALKIKERSPDTNVFVLYRDLRTYGFNEAYYRKAREKGVRFIRYEGDEKPEVSRDNGRLKVAVHDPVLDAKVNINCDLLILAAATVPRDGNKDLAQKLRLPLTEDGFFLEAHMKLRPVDFASDGIFLCGLAHSPKLVDESIAQASAAAARASTILSKQQIQLEAGISEVVDENCDGCAYCVDPCPFEAITLIEYMKDGAVKKTVESDPAKCRGCGVCQATCPKQGIFVRNFRLDQISAMVDAALTIG